MCLSIRYTAITAPSSTPQKPPQISPILSPPPLSSLPLKPLPTSPSLIPSSPRSASLSSHPFPGEEADPSSSASTFIFADMGELLALTLMLFISSAAAKLSPTYYDQSCPTMQSVISQVVTGKQISNPTTAAGALRLFFHDCMVSGCDASVLISTNAFNKAERDADINLSLPGDAFDVVIRAKAQLELTCPGIVSCADIMALATRDLVSALGGPFYNIHLGRKDALASTAASVGNQLPRPNMTMDQIISSFSAKGFTIREMVALSGAHTVGFSHCKEFADRIYGYNGGGANAYDPSMDPRYAQALQKACVNYKTDATIATFNDVMTPGKFDNLYFQNIQRGLGLLASDHLMVADKRTAPIVQEYAANQSLFFSDFAHAMEKLSVYGVKTGKKGEVRRSCDKFNTIPE